MGRRRRGRKSRARAAAVTRSRGNAASKGVAVKRAQKVVNKQAAGGAPKSMFVSGGPETGQGASSKRKVDFATQGLGRRSPGLNSQMMQQGRVKPSGGAKGAQGGLQERFTKSKAGRGRGKQGQSPIDQGRGGREMGGGFRNRAFGMGRNQRGYGMGQDQMPDFSGNKGFGMGRDSRASGMGRQEMMQNRGYNSSMQSKGRPQQGGGVKGGQMGRPQPEGRPMNPVIQDSFSPPSRPSNPRPNERNVQAPTSPRAGRGSSSFNPSTGRMEYASQPSNFSRSSQRPAYGGFRKNMGTTQGAFKLPTKSQIKK